MPNLFIVGAPKCGTTALHNWLAGHPEVFMSEIKEPLFFGADMAYPIRRTLEQYLHLFAGARNEKWVGEASTSYLASEHAATEIKQFSPSARVLIMLRNPVEAMYSRHSQRLYYGTEDIADFEAALSAEEERKRGLRLPRRPGVIQGLFYREGAKYSVQVKRYLNVFGRENVQVIIFDDLKRSPGQVFRKTLRFLEVSTEFWVEPRIVNSNKRIRSTRLHEFMLSPPSPVQRIARFLFPEQSRRSVFVTLRRLNTAQEPRPPMDPELRRRLQQEFAPEVAQLSELLGRDLTSWSKD